MSLGQTEPLPVPARRELKQPQKAVWGKNRPYKRHSVDRDFKRFSGFHILRQIVFSARNNLVRAFIAFLWATGGRVTEALNLRKGMFRVSGETDPPILVVSEAPLEKRYVKRGEYLECLVCGELNPKSKECGKCGADLVANGKRHYITEKLDKRRNEFVIRLDDPFSEVMLDWLKESDDYLFLNWQTNKPYSRKWAYLKVREIGDSLKLELWPNKFRAERASYLAMKLRAEDLLEWFSWEDWKTAKKYAKKGALGLARELGVKLQQEEGDELDGGHTAAEFFEMVRRVKVQEEGGGLDGSEA